LERGAAASNTSVAAASADSKVLVELGSIGLDQ